MMKQASAPSPAMVRTWFHFTRTMQLAISVGRDEGDALVEAYKLTALREIAAD